jgi:hypothetical protein
MSGQRHRKISPGKRRPKFSDTWWGLECGKMRAGNPRRSWALTWIGLYQRRGNDVLTSEQIAASVGINPVISVDCPPSCEKPGWPTPGGAGAGRTLARDLASITLLDVYEAIEPQPTAEQARSRTGSLVVDVRGDAVSGFLAGRSRKARLRRER